MKYLLLVHFFITSFATAHNLEDLKKQKDYLDASIEICQITGQVEDLSKNLKKAMMINLHIYEEMKNENHANKFLDDCKSNIQILSDIEFKMNSRVNLNSNSAPNFRKHIHDLINLIEKFGMIKTQRQNYKYVNQYIDEIKIYSDNIKNIEKIDDFLFFYAKLIHVLQETPKYCYGKKLKKKSKQLLEEIFKDPFFKISKFIHDTETSISKIKKEKEKFVFYVEDADIYKNLSSLLFGINSFILDNFIPYHYFDRFIAISDDLKECLKDFPFYNLNFLNLENIYFILDRIGQNKENTYNFLQEFHRYAEILNAPFMVARTKELEAYFQINHNNNFEGFERNLTYAQNIHYQLGNHDKVAEINNILTEQSAQKGK